MSFNDIIGHDEEIAFLKDVLRGNRISSSYIFTGPDSVGKRTVAINFAKALNCMGDEKPCEACLRCKKVDSLNFPDLFIVEPQGKEGAIKIGTIRELRKEANTKPYEGSYKIFIIDEADAMTQESQNALLKTLEETPPKSVFIMITAFPYRILPTVLSRSSIIKFKTVSIERISDYLAKRFSIGETEAIMLSKLSGGRLGEAIRLKNSDAIKRKNSVIDKLIFGFGNESASDFGMAWDSLDRETLKENLLIMLSWFRDIFIFKMDNDRNHIVNCDRIDEIRRESDRIDREKLDNIIDKLMTLDSYVDMNVNPKIIIDSLVSELVC